MNTQECLLLLESKRDQTRIEADALDALIGIIKNATTVVTPEPGYEADRFLAPTTDIPVEGEITTAEVPAEPKTMPL